MWVGAAGPWNSREHSGCSPRRRRALARLRSPRFETHPQPEVVMARRGRAGLHAALISRILYFIAPRGAVTSTVSPFLWPMIALPTGDSFESLFCAGFASAEPTMWYSTVCLAATSRSFTFEPTETTSFATSFLLITLA